ncbi:MAG: sugar ABC transporter ATP-binding protein [Clostridia bacterium]|nr:sugar ABC transporter ATP-binding protein [Clostridia bacterium]
MKTPILEMKHIRKTFASTVALGDVSFDVYPGEIRGLIGENGSGKSTISSIAAGMQKADSGEMLYHGKPWEPSSMIDALNRGIGMIVQESGTIQGISVAENLFLGEIDRFRKLGLIDRRAMNREADKALKAIGVANVTGGMPMGAIDFQTRKLVEIAKVMMKDPEILVVDETSTALSQEGRSILYELTKRLRDEGKAVLFISHDLDEIMEVCDTLTVLRDGAIIRHFTKDEFDADAIRTSMIGRELQGDYYRSDTAPSHLDEIAVEAKHISFGNVLHDVDLTVYRGEIVGVGGLSHCGMHPLGKILFGALKPDQGEVVTGKGVKITNETVAMRESFGYVSKDRDVESLSLNASIRDNIAIAGMERYAVKNFLMLNGKEKEYVDKQISGLSIKCADRDQQTSQLSGGNKQKVVFGKWIGRGSEVLILDCPTRGVDIGVKHAMYRLMTELKNEGKAIIMISEEMPELMGMCDRLIILKDGRVMHEFLRSSTLSDADIIQYMI